MGSLGCGTYTCAVLTRGGGTLLGVAPVSTVRWSRVLDDTSEATFEIPANVDCPGWLADVRPWRHEAAIFRDQTLVWVGPIQRPSNPVDSFTIEARDVTTWWDVRRIHEDHDFVQEDLSVIFKALSDDAMAPDPSPGLTVAPTVCGVTANITILGVQHQIAGSQLRDLANIGIDWTVVGRSVLCGGLVVPADPIGYLTDEHFLTPPQPRYAGEQQVNSWVVRGQGGGAAGDTIYGVQQDDEAIAADGLLEGVDTVSTVQDNDSALAAAKTKLALTRSVLLVEQAVLAPSAPVSLAALVPGATCAIDLAETVIPVRGTYRLQRVDVEVNALTAQETVTLTLQPEGTT